MRHFIVQITYTAPTEQIDTLRPAHRAFLQGGYDRGWLLMSGPLTPPSGGIVVARAPSLEDLHALFEADPYRQNTAAEYAFTEFTPVMRQSFLEDWAG